MLPLVVLMFLLARWAGGLVSRFGARGPLIIGPLIAAAGFALLARPGVGGSYWQTYFPAIIVLGLGLSVSVAPLTTVVMNSVEQRRAGAASGINNAVSQTAGLLALALCVPLFFHTFSSSLTGRLRAADVQPEVAQKIESQKQKLAGIETTDAKGRMAVNDAFVAAFRLLMLVASTSAVAASATALFTIQRNQTPGGREP